MQKPVVEHSFLNGICLITPHAMPPAVHAGGNETAWESGGKKPLQRNFRAPHYTLPLGTFTLFIFYLMNGLHFSAIQAPHKFALVLVSLSALGKNHGGELEGIKMCIQTPVYLILIIVACLFCMTGNLYIKSQKIYF